MNKNGIYDRIDINYSEICNGGFVNKIIMNSVIGVLSFSWTILMTMYGLFTHDSQATALGVFTSAVGVSFFVWSFAKKQENVSLFCRLMLTASVGVSIYTTFTWVVWKLGYPISVGAVLNNKMAEAEPMIFFSWFLVIVTFWLFKYES